MGRLASYVGSVFQQFLWKLFPMIFTAFVSGTFSSCFHLPVFSLFFVFHLLFLLYFSCFTFFFFFIKFVNFSEIRELLSNIFFLFQMSLNFVLNKWTFLNFVILSKFRELFSNYKLFPKSVWTFFNPWIVFHFLWTFLQITNFSKCYFY